MPEQSAATALDVALAALREIDSPVQMPGAYLDNAAGQAEWWKHTAAKRREIASDALAKIEAQS